MPLGAKARADRAIDWDRFHYHSIGLFAAARESRENQEWRLLGSEIGASITVPGRLRSPQAASSTQQDRRNSAADRNPHNRRRSNHSFQAAAAAGAVSG